MSNSDTVQDVEFTITPSSELLLSDLSRADSAFITSMKRYLPYTSPKSDKGEGEYDVVFEVIVVVRQDINTVSSDEAAQKLYAVADETLKKWYKNAGCVWDGEGYPPEEDEEFWNRQYTIEPRVGASHVTVFGNIVDKEGRFISLTITDQTDMHDVVLNTPYSMWLYDSASELGGGDLSPFGVNPNNIRKTTAVDFEMRRNTRFNKPAADKGLPAPATSAPSINEEPVICETISDLRALPKDSLFTIKVGRAVFVAPKGENDSGMMVLNGFSTDANNNPVLETKENIFMHGNRNGFDLLVADFAKSGNPIVSGEEKRFESPVTIIGIKRIGNSGKAFYDKLRIQ